MSLKRLLVNLSALVLAIVLSACGNNSGDNSSDMDLIPKITASDRIFTQEEFLSTGLKKSKERGGPGNLHSGISGIAA